MDQAWEPAAPGRVEFGDNPLFDRVVELVSRAPRNVVRLVIALIIIVSPVGSGSSEELESPFLTS